MEMRVQTLVHISALAALLDCGQPSQPHNNTTPPALRAKVYVANEMDGTVSVLDRHTGALLSTVDLTQGPVMFMGHNVHMSTATRRVVVTAPVMVMPDTPPDAQDQLVVLDPTTDVIERRVPLGVGMGAAHVVSHPTTGEIYVSAFNRNQVLRVGSGQSQATLLATLGEGRGPHGLALCGNRLVVANMDGHSAHVIDVDTGAAAETTLGGMAVQAACAPDGHAAYITLFDLGQLVQLDLTTKDIQRIQLIATPRGPVQVAVSPDGQYAYVADQGMLLNRPPSRWLYQVDLAAMVVSQLTEVGSGAHGVALSKNGALAVVTNAADNTVSYVATAGLATIHTVNVGTKPNGVAVFEP
jgi:YVTN family beta-propeller protein